MVVGIYTNLNKDIDGVAAKQLINILVKKNVDYYICSNSIELIKDSNNIAFDKLVDLSDVIFAFGGDGTMLKVVSLSNENQKPIVGVNLGKIGFLTDVAVDQMEKAVDLLIKGNYKIEKRQLLKVKTNQSSYYSLNEAVLQTVSGEHISVVSINIDDSYATTVRSDGVMVSTPTGSTAYSLACNGPILSPNVKAFIVNSICPHSLHSVPMVISDESEVRLKSLSKNMKLVVDGKIKEIYQNDNEEIIITKAKHQALFIRFGNENFYQKLLQKLSYWGD
ncbi:MAG: NAD(+)/NADH kinase [Christensenella sp.]|nr:NAD(+)/NADH kinase [Christensenella sp.]